MEVLVCLEGREDKGCSKPLMGRHRPVSQTVIMSFSSTISGKLEGSTVTHPRTSAWSVSEPKNLLSAVSSQSNAVTVRLPCLVRDTLANYIIGLSLFQWFDNQDFFVSFLEVVTIAFGGFDSFLNRSCKLLVRYYSAGTRVLSPAVDADNWKIISLIAILWKTILLPGDSCQWNSIFSCWKVNIAYRRRWQIWKSGKHSIPQSFQIL